MIARRSSTSRGFTLTEVLVVIVLLMAFVPVATVLTGSILRRTRDARVAENRLLMSRRMLDTLRADVWGAWEMAVGNERTAVVRRPAGVSISWIVLPAEQAVQRTVVRGEKTIERQRWEPLKVLPRFAMDGRALVITAPRDPLLPPDELRLVSELDLLSGGPP